MPPVNAIRCVQVSLNPYSSWAASGRWKQMALCSVAISRHCVDGVPITENLLGERNRSIVHPAAPSWWFDRNTNLCLLTSGLPAHTARFALVRKWAGTDDSKRWCCGRAGARQARWVERVLGGIAVAVGTYVSAPNSSELELSILVWIQEKEWLK